MASGSDATGAGDPAARLLSGMSVGEWKRVSGPIGNLVHCALPFTRANFDAYGTEGFGTFSSGASIGGLNAANMAAYSKGAIDPVRSVILLAGGGHVAWEDGSFYRFDIRAACAAVLSGGHGVWTVAAKTGRLTPITEPKPADCHDLWGGSYTMANGRGSSGNNQITLSDTKGTLGVGDFVSVASGAPRAIPAGTIIKAISGSLITLSNPLQSSLRATPLNIYAQDYWSGKSASGQSMPISSHTYNAFNWVPGSTLCLTGGSWGNYSNNSRPGGYVYDDSKPDGSNVVFASNVSGKGYWDACPVAFCPGDAEKRLYVWDGNGSFLGRISSPFTTSQPVNLATHLTKAIPAAYSEGVIVPDVVHPRRWMFFSHITNTTTAGGFGLLLNMYPDQGATYTNEAGTYDNDPGSFWSRNIEGLTFCYNSDLRAAVGYDNAQGNGRIQRISINSSLRATLADVFASPSGDIPVATGYPRIAYDAAHKCYIVQVTGDVYIAKAA